MTTPNDIDTLRRRVETLERIVRPLAAARTAARTSDDAVVGALADQIGVDIARLQGDERTRGVTAARKVAARILAEEVGWTAGRIARALRKDKSSVSGMLGK